MNFLLKRIIKKGFLKFGFKVVRKKSFLKKELLLDYNAITGIASYPFNKAPFAAETLEYLVQNFEFNSVLDVGSGEGKHSDVFKECGKNVTSIDFGKSSYFEQREDSHTCIFGDYYTYNFVEKFDAIWASHVLEHQPNPNLFLKKINADLKEEGILAITVPPLKHEIVGGHVTLWNAGILLYQLVLAGFNCKDVSIKSYGYNISIVLKKVSILSLPELSFDKGDIIKLKEFFPDGFGEPFNGDIKELNWLKNY